MQKYVSHINIFSCVRKMKGKYIDKRSKRRSGENGAATKRRRITVGVRRPGGEGQTTIVMLVLFLSTVPV